jgi:Na+-translocating ferredoxin:NAD+ oxidoreductase subunit E
MPETRYSDLSIAGLWKNNPALVQLLGLCPLLAASGNVVKALGLGLATTLVLMVSSLCVSLLRNSIADAVRLPVFVLIIASAVTCVELLMQAFAYPLFQVLGIFLPLIVTNCAILGRAESFASQHSPGPALYDGFVMGMGFASVLVILGALREALGTGALFAGMELLFGPAAAQWKIAIFAGDTPFLLATLPPAAFILMGLLIAGKNLIDTHLDKRAAAIRTKPVKGARRVRVTGTIS